MRLTAEGAIKLISESGGVAAVGTPPYDRQRCRRLYRSLPALRGARHHRGRVLVFGVSPEQRIDMARLAEQFGLIPTGGSDYHGANKPGIAVGTGRDLAVPDEAVAALEARRQK